jgi:hypothetical protein
MWFRIRAVIVARVGRDTPAGEIFPPECVTFLRRAAMTN